MQRKQFYKLAQNIIVSREFLDKVYVIKKEGDEIIFTNMIGKSILTIDLGDYFDLDSDDESVDEKGTQLLESIYEQINNIEHHDSTIMGITSRDGTLPLDLFEPDDVNGNANAVKKD